MRTSPSSTVSRLNLLCASHLLPCQLVANLHSEPIPGGKGKKAVYFTLPELGDFVLCALVLSNHLNIFAVIFFSVIGPFN